MPDIAEKMNLFRRVCEQATEVAERFGLGVVRSDYRLIVYATSPHMGSCSSNEIPKTAQHYFRVRVYNSGSSWVSWWPYPVISNIGTIKLDAVGPISSDDRLYGKFSNLKDFDPDVFARVTEQVVNRINEFERRLDARDQSDAILAIRSSSENLRFAIDGTNPRLEATLYPCAGPEYT